MNKHIATQLLFIVQILILIASPTFAASPDLLFKAGNNAYLEGNYDEALKHWLQIEKDEYQGGALFYNIGNAYHKTGRLGLSILYWEKAARLLGEDEDLSANLQIARARLIDKLEEPVRLPVWDWFDSFRAQMPTSILATAGVLLCFVMFAFIGVRRWFVKSTSIRVWLARVAWVMMALLIFDLSLITLQARDDRSRIEGILIEREAEVLSAPAEGTGKLLFTLHEGTKVKVLRSLEGWFEILVGKDKQGWVRSDLMRVI